MKENKDEIKWVEPKEWLEFRNSGMLWLTNRLLHVFGWALVFELDNNGTKIVNKVYPARCRFRGFDKKTDDSGFRRISQHMKEQADELIKDCDL